jgi:type IV pilus assembly protein PilE
MRNAGFTLIELMIAVAILAIVAAIALPLYNQYSQRTYRTEAQADLMNCAQAMERFAAENFSYEVDVATFVADVCDPRSVDQNRYAITVEVPEPDEFKLIATPVAGGPMSADGTMTLDHAGNRERGDNDYWEED